MTARRALLSILLLSPLATAGGAGQDGRLPAVDPYTEGDPERIARAGYVSYAPFSFLPGQPTAKVDEVVGQPLLWVETEHFRLGSGLREYKLPGDKTEKKKLRGELKRLAAKLEDVPARPRELDPWLRVHLFAQRLEDLYAEFEERFGVVDGAVRTADGPQALEGPYLGQREKFTVLLCEKQSTLGRYGTRFLPRSPSHTARHYFVAEGSLFCGTSTEALGGYDTDSALHCMVAYAVAANLADGYRTFIHETPLWLGEGIGHWFSRRVDPRWVVYSNYVPDADDWKWDVRVRRRVEQDYFPSCEEMFGWRDVGKIRLGEQLVLWSRVDYLMREHAEGLPAFLFAVKGTLPPVAETDSLVALQVDALQQAFGLAPGELEERWARWVKKTYPKR